MRRRCQFLVPGANTHLLQCEQVKALQEIVEGLGADTYPLFLRLGGANATLQPVTARTLLAEVEHFRPRLSMRLIPGIRLYGKDREELGSLFNRGENHVLAKSDAATLAITSEGIRVALRQFPPPVGFRSRPGLERGYYECFFKAIHHTPEGYLGERTEAMGGSGAPVALPELPVPPVTQWHHARVSGRPHVALLEYVEVPAPEVYRDVVHAVATACTDSLRLKVPMHVRVD